MEVNLQRREVPEGRDGEPSTHLLKQAYGSRAAPMTALRHCLVEILAMNYPPKEHAFRGFGVNVKAKVSSPLPNGEVVLADLTIWCLADCILQSFYKPKSVISLGQTRCVLKIIARCAE